MFRLRPIIARTCVVLSRTQPCRINYVTSSSTLHKLRVKERPLCDPPPPPPPPPPKDDKVLWGTLAAAIVAGAFVVYARGNQELRDWLTIHAAWLDDFIAVVFQENMTYGEYACNVMDNVKVLFSETMDDNRPKECSLESNPANVVAVPEKPKEDKPPVITLDICDVQKCINELSETVYNNYLTARDACIYYNEQVEVGMKHFSYPLLRELRDSMEERKELVREHVDNAEKGLCKFDGLLHYFECGVKAPQDEIDKAKAMIKHSTDRMKSIEIEYQWQNDRALAMDDLWQKVENLMLDYAQENETLFPGLKYDSKNPKMQGDVDLLLYHAARYAKQLRVDLDEAAETMSERSQRAFESLPDDEKSVKDREAKMNAAVTKKRAEMLADINNMYEHQKKDNENKLKQELDKRQKQHEELMKVKLEEKEVETTKKLEKMLEDAAEAERKTMKEECDDMAKKLKAVKDTLNAHIKAERERKRSQEIWSAAASLLIATKKGDQIVKVDKELNALEKATGCDDPLMEAVLKAIPESVRSEGLVPESVLRKRYHSMEKVALGVALVEQEGGPLPIYFLSYLQSWLLFMKLDYIPKAELYEKADQDPPEYLDTFDLMQRARYWIERGNLSQAMRYVSALKGASRGAARGWGAAAGAHLATRQAAEAARAHAAALGLMYM